MSERKFTYFYLLTSLLNRVPCVPACQRGLRANVIACQRGVRANVLAWQFAKSVPSSHKACQCFNLAYQHAKRRVNFLTWRANVPKSVPIFQTSLLRNAKENFYTLLLYKEFCIIFDIILIHILCVCIVHINCIILYFLKLFCSLDRNGNIKTPGFYTLQVTREYCDLLELWPAWAGDPR